MANESGRGIKHLYRAFAWSMAGFRSAFRGEAAFRQEVFVCCILLPLGIWLGDSALERSLLIGSLLIVLMVELINTAIESTIDLVSPDQHLLAGRAKDCGSAAVFLAIVNAVTIWAFLLLT